MPRNANKHRCSAKSKRSGQQCRSWAVQGHSKCRMHGGTAAAKMRGNTNAVTHGIYCAHLTPDEEALVPKIQASIGTLDQELVTARISLKRLVDDEHRFFNAQTPADKAALLERIGIRQTVTEATGKKEVVLRPPDFSRCKDRALARIAHLETIQCQLRTFEAEKKLKEINRLLAAHHPA